MSALFSVTIWWMFFERALKACHPVTFILAALALLVFFRRPRALKALWDSPAAAFAACFFLVDLTTRLLLFFAGVPYQDRYFLPIAVLAIILAAKMLFDLSPRLAGLMEKRLPKFPLNAGQALFCLLGVMFCVNAGKVLIPRWDKPEIKQVVAAVRANCPAGETPVVVSDFPDPRYAYYAGAEYLYIPTPKEFAARGEICQVAPDGLRRQTTTLTDASLETAVSGGAGAFFTLQLKHPMALSPALAFRWRNPPEKLRIFIPEGRPGKQVSANPSEPRPWRLLYDGPPKPVVRLPLALYQTFKVAPFASGIWRLDDFRLFMSPPWEIHRPGHGDSCGKWLSAGLPAGLTRLADAFRVLGARRTFLLLRDKDETAFRSLFAAGGADFPFRKVYDFRSKRKGRSLTLYALDLDRKAPPGDKKTAR